MKNIYVIAPLTETPDSPMTAEVVYRNTLQKLEIPDLIKLIPVFIKNGPNCIENEVDDALCLADTLRAGLAARDDSDFPAHGIIVNCMCDPGVKALRCLLDIPVVGPAETAFHIAASLGHRFSIIDIGDDTGPMVEEQITRYGLGPKFASIRGTSVTVHGIEEMIEKKDYTVLGQAALKAVLEDRADVIVLGCTGFDGCAEKVSAFLKENDISGVPVIDPLSLAVRTFSAIVLEGLCHSKRAFRTPVRNETKILHSIQGGNVFKEFYTVK